MIVLTTTVKYLRQIFRSRAKTAILLLSPIVFFSFFGFVFSADSGVISFSIGVIDADIGYDLSNVDNPYGVPFGDSMANQFLDLFENHTQQIVETSIELQVIGYDDLEDMTDDLEGQQIQLGIVIPQDFTVAILSGINQTYNQTIYPVANIHAALEIYGDPTTSNYQTVLSLVQQSMDSYISGFVGMDALYDEPPKGGYLSYSQSSILTQKFNAIDFFFPGFLVFLIILQAITIASSLTYERESGTMTRLKLSRMYSWELFAGITIGQMVAFTLQFAVSVVVLSLWDVNLDASGWFKIYIISQCTNITIIGLCLIVASFVDSVDKAGSITGIGSAPLGFLSGSFLEVPEVFIIPSLNIQFWDLIPTYHANLAIREIMFFDAGLGDIVTRLVTLIIYGIVLYGIGIFAFNRRVVNSDI